MVDGLMSQGNIELDEKKNRKEIKDNVNLKYRQTNG